jgi:hypothetical protein
MSSAIIHTTKELREWHSRADPNTYQVWFDDDAEGIFANVAVLTILVPWWLAHPLDEIDNDLIDRVLAFPGVKPDGPPTSRRRRALKLILDAAREVYHFAAFTETGVNASYSPTDDLDGVDLTVTYADSSVKLQIGMRQGGEPYWIDDVKNRRGNYSDEATQVKFNTDDADRRFQPYVPTRNQYWWALDAVLPTFTQRTFD